MLTMHFIVGIEPHERPGWHKLLLAATLPGEVLFEVPVPSWQLDQYEIGAVLPVTVTIS